MELWFEDWWYAGRVLVDGKVVNTWGPRLWKPKELKFDVAGENASVIRKGPWWQRSWWWQRFDLYVGGTFVGPGERSATQQLGLLLAFLGFMLLGGGVGLLINEATKEPMPSWVEPAFPSFIGWGIGLTCGGAAGIILGFAIAVGKPHEWAGQTGVPQVGIGVSGVRCPVCGFESPVHAQFCRNCGTKLEATSPRAFCTHCGSQVSPGAQFCSQCGQNLTKGMGGPVAESPPKSF